MHLERRWFRTVVCATALGWVGLVVGCGGAESDSPDDTECRGGCPEQETPTPDEEGSVPPPMAELPDAGTPDSGSAPPPLEPPPPPPPPTSGSTLWMARQGSAQDDLALDAAVDARGAILTVAVHELDDLQEREPTDDTVRLVVSRYSEAGEPTWSRGYTVRVAETPKALRANARALVAPAPDGGFFLAVTAEGLVDFEPQELGNGAFLARLDAAGSVVWARPVDGDGVTLTALVVDAQGRPTVAANSTGWSVFGEGVEGDGALVVRYSPEGAARGWT